MEMVMKEKPKQPPTLDPEEARRRAKEDHDRMAGNATAAAEHIADRAKRAEMSDEEKLQERTDDLMRRTP
jgi:hypothetical protein